MAKRPQNRLLTDTFREIRNTRSRFISLMVLSALAVCFLAGLRATAPDMKNSADIYFDEQKLMDLRVVGTLGLTEEDATALEQQPGIQALERAYTVDAILHLTENDYIIKALSFTTTPGLNAPKLVSGRMPQSSGECLVEPLLLQETGLQIGDSITLDTGNGAFENALSSPTYTIVGTANSPLYVGVERGSSTLGTGKVSAFLLLPLEAFDMDAYTDFYLQVEGMDALLCYSDAYTDGIDAFKEKLDSFAQNRAQARGDEIRNEANEKLAEAELELTDAESEFNREIADAQQELDNARAELDDGWKEYRDGVDQLNQEVLDVLQKLDNAQKELDAALLQLEDGEQQLADGRKELDNGWKEYEEGLTQYETGLKAYQEGDAKYQEGLSQYQAGKAELDAARAQYESAYSQYQAGVNALESGKKELQAQETAFDNGLTALRTNLPALNPSLNYPDNQALLSAMSDPTQAVAIDAALIKSRTDLQSGIALLESISFIRQQLGEHVDTDMSDLESQKRQLQDSISMLGLQKAGLELQLSLLNPNAQDYQAKKAKLEAQLSECNHNLDQATKGLSQLESLITARKLLMELEAQRDSAGLTNATPEQLQSQLDNLYIILGGQKLPVSTVVLLSAHKMMESGWEELRAGEAELAAAKVQLDEAKAQLISGEQALEQPRSELEAARAELDAAHAELESGRLELEAALAQLQQGEQELTDARKKLDQGWKDYNQGLSDLEEGRLTLDRQISDARQELNSAQTQLQDGERDFADGLQKFNEGKAEGEQKIADARKELEQARRDVDNLDESQWYLLGRNTNMGYMSYSMDADRMGNLASVFPLIFFLVAALVCLTTMTRMVEEQRITIGGLKALGYSKGQIAVKYVGYGFLASAAGSLVGLAVGLTLIPWIICNAWNIIYQLGPTHYSLEPVTSSIACLAAIGTVTLAALGACFSTLAAVPAQLMRPKAPPAGKRVLLEKLPFLWRRLSFNYKITLRNLFRYQKRFWMTVIGIGGCAALIITAFGLRGSIFDVMDKQFDELYTHTAHVGLVDNVTPGELREVTQVLDESDLVNNWLACRSENVTTETTTYTVDATLQVFSDQASVAPMIDLRHRTDDEAVIFPDDGVVLTEKLAKLLDVRTGDTFILDGEKRVEVRVADVTEHYIQHYVYMTQAYYRTLFDLDCEDNLILVDYPVEDAGAEALELELVSLDGVTSLSRISDTRKTFSSSLASVDYAVVLIIVCAAALAFVVLYNLTNINITERMRELATLKVLGFYDGELSAYVYRENVILTVFGVAMGMLMGKLLHQWLILTVEIDLLMFGRVLAPSCYIYSIVLTVLFSLLVNLSAHKKLKKLAMVESLKTVE